jgi:hypothetical protein
MECSVTKKLHYLRDSIGQTEGSLVRPELPTA